MRLLRLVTAMVAWFGLLGPAASAAEAVPTDAEISSFLTHLYQARAELFINQQPDTLRRWYLPNERTSAEALRIETTRAKYLAAWAQKQNITWKQADDRIRITRLKVEGDRAKVSLLNTLRLTYAYPEKEMSAQSFGLGTRHSLTLQKVQGQWFVLREWYSDPFDVDPKLSTGSNAEYTRRNLKPPAPDTPVRFAAKKYNRQRAVAYANKYAGAAWGAGNDHRYNPKYLDYSYVGGDCTNFASQAVGDPKEGGGLPMSSTWRYINKAGGTAAWVRTDSFKDYILQSGSGRLIAHGSYEQIVKRTEKHPGGAISLLQPGDLIAYELRPGDVDHFCIVVGFDPKGYPLVNSHSADRFAMPFDLGWDTKTGFILIHIID